MIITDDNNSFLQEIEEECLGTCNCKVVGINGTSASMSNSETWEIRSDLPTTVTSVDGSVTVVPQITNTPDGKNKQRNYDLSVKCCDEKVKVCESSPSAGYIRDVISVDGDILTVNYDCVNNEIVLGINEANLPAPELADEKVKWNSSCDSEYLGDTVGLTNQFAWYDDDDASVASTVNDTYCGKRYIGVSCDKCVSTSIVKMRLASDYIIEQEMDTSGFYVLTSESVSGNFFPGIPVTSSDRGGNQCAWNIEMQYGGLEANTDGSICNTCDVDRIVEVQFKGNIEASWGVNGLRVQVYRKSATGALSAEPVAERRDSPTSDPDADGDGLPDNYQVTSAGFQNGRLNAGYKYQERQNFDASEPIILKSGECLVCVFKVSSFNDDPDYIPGTPAQVSILGKLGTDGTVTGELGAFFWVKTIDDICLLREYREQCAC